MKPIMDFFIITFLPLTFPYPLHPVNRYTHKHAMADVIKKPQSQADTPSPVDTFEGK
jgi:hypothetical protein